MLTVGVDGMMSVDDLPFCSALFQLTIKPRQLRFRNLVCVQRKKLHRTRSEGVVRRRHPPAWAACRIKDLCRGTVALTPVVIPERRVKLYLQRVVELFPLALPTRIRRAGHAGSVEVVAQSEPEIERIFLVQLKYGVCSLLLSC